VLDKIVGGGKALKENYYALLICILKPITIETSFQMLNGIFPKRNHTDVHKDDVKDMIRMRQQGITYREIGEVYGMSDEAIYRRIKRFKEAIA
jgi:hypothetical protein